MLINSLSSQERKHAAFLLFFSIFFLQISYLLDESLSELVPDGLSDAPRLFGRVCLSLDWVDEVAGRDWLYFVDGLQMNRFSFYGDFDV